MVKINKELCVGCGSCAKDCISGAIRVVDGKAEAKDGCLLCGHCVAICPTRAVSIPEYGMEDVEEYSPESFELSPETLLRAIKFRRSVRDFLPEKIGPEALERLFQAGRYTATARNNQDCSFVLVQEARQELEALTWQAIESRIPAEHARIPEELRPFVTFLRRWQRNPADDYLFRNAPAVLFIASHWALDAGLAAQNIELMAVAQGLGVQYNGFLQRLAETLPEIKSWLGLEEKPIQACLLLGHPRVKYLRTAPRRAAQITIK